jgi:biotin transport system substrate-specific component
MNQSKTLVKFNHLSDVKKALILSVLLGASSIVSFKLPFMPVSWVIQNQLAVLIGFVFGARVGFLSALFFLIEGVLGAPVFSLGRSGLGMILGTSGGYLLAYPVAAFVAGALRQKAKQSFLSTFAILSLANLIIYTLGVTQLSAFIGLKSAMMLGAVPFLALDAFKNALAALIIKFKKI